MQKLLSNSIKFTVHTEQEIDIIIQMCVFSGDKTGFVRLGHISNIMIYQCIAVYRHSDCILIRTVFYD